MSDMSKPVDRRSFVIEAASRAAAGCLAMSTLQQMGLPASFNSNRVRAEHRSPRDFHMLVIGDSIMWGQGLSDENKFTTKVQRWLEPRLVGNRSVVRHVYAHSGATISPNGSGASDIGDDRGFIDWYGEYNRSRMSITYQVSWAHADLRKNGINARDVDLILFDGGINDLGADKIISPMSTKDFVQSKAAEGVGALSDLLATLLCVFPQAQVVVTSYYPIVSEKTDPTVLEGLFRAFLDPSLVPLWFTARPGVVERCAAFDMTFRQMLPGAVASANRRACGGGNRAVAVLIPWQPEFSYGVPNTTHLWNAFEADDVRNDRMSFCDSRLGVGDPQRVLCENASAGHPNREGAVLFADTITRALEPLVGLWNAGPAPAPAPIPATPVLIVSMEPLPTPGQPATVIVKAIDRATKVPVAGAVKVNGTVVANTNTKFTYTFNCTSRALRTSTGATELQRCDQVVVSAHGYPDAHVTIAEIDR